MILKLTGGSYPYSVYDETTGSIVDFQSITSSNINFYRADNFNLDFSVPKGTYQYAWYIIPDINGKSTKDLILTGSESSMSYVSIMDLSTLQIIKEWKNSTISYSHNCMISNNRILLIIYYSVSGSPTFEIYDVGGSTSAGITDNLQNVNLFSLGQNYPNPFNPSTTIEYNISKPSVSKISIYDISGKVINTYSQNNLQAGKYEYHWDGLNSSGIKLASGIYIYELEVDGYREAKKMVMLK